MPRPNEHENNDQATEQTVVDTDATVESATDDLTDAENAGQTAAGVSTDDSEIETDATTFSRTYVEKLRRESAGYRERANQTDALAQRLHNSLVAATGRLADPTDLPFDAAHLDDADALESAIDELLTRKPHLASRRLNGDIGQGNRGGTSEPVNLADMLRARA
ncbi:hypothetical protein A7U43_14060 [Mycobacterium adipatum]|uniref:Uncharacterized protein n=1 Tax=Mycobacterium adipatum TaxID=1682113 RepID=A0A172UMM5_9MYCO|nr:hypothetical protein [Mycobacterium adipatum]ANE80283.1 hypothetical protein A7U43_14060 [Mycobacterium adipatum]